MSDAILSIRGLRKTYGTGVDALKSVDLDIRRGEIFALLGPNGAGKTTLINIVCGIVTPSDGEVLVDGKNWQSDYRHARERIGLVPQELTTEAFETVWIISACAADDEGRSGAAACARSTAARSVREFGSGRRARCG